MKYSSTQSNPISESSEVLFTAPEQFASTPQADTISVSAIPPYSSTVTPHLPFICSFVNQSITAFVLDVLRDLAVKTHIFLVHPNYSENVGGVDGETEERDPLFW